MAKQFFDVFPTLKLDKKIQDLFEQVMVEKVSATRSREFIRVTMICDYLIPKETIYRVEGEIKKQFFSAHNVTVKLYEKFHLSGQYTPEKLMNAYRDSILLELKNYSPVEYNLFRGADVTFPQENELCITLEDTVPAKEKEAELSRILEKIFNERCGFSIGCQVAYKEKKTGKYKEEDDLKIAHQVAEITQRAFSKAAGEESKAGYVEEASAFGTGENAMSQGAVQKEKTNTNGKMPAGGETNAGSGGTSVESRKKGNVQPFPGNEKRGYRKGEFKRAIKRSDNPDVIYGRDFEEDAIPIEDILGEMGEVVIRGKIINFDLREIKNERTILIFDVTDYTDTMTIKMFVHNDQVAELKDTVKPGNFVKLKGITTIDKFDNELTIGSLSGMKKIPDFTVPRKDNSARKRVELHCHTKMSDMDGVSEAKDIVKRAYKWGHPGIAITDHGVVQAFPDRKSVV